MILACQIVGGYAGVMAVVLGLVGSFSGPVPLAVGGVHGLVAVALLGAARGIARGSFAALGLLRLVAASLGGILPACALGALPPPGPDPAEWIFPAVLAAVGVALLAATWLPAVRAWTGTTPAPGLPQD